MEPGATVFFVTAIVLLAAYVAFQQWLRQQRRVMIHRERLAALEKGVELPALEQEVQGIAWNLQRLLLFAGIIWVSLGVGAYLVLNALIGETFHFYWGEDRLGNLIWLDVEVRNGMQWIGAALFGIGIAHLVVFAVGKGKER